MNFYSIKSKAEKIDGGFQKLRACSQAAASPVNRARSPRRSIYISHLHMGISAGMSV